MNKRKLKHFEKRLLEEKKKVVQKLTHDKDQFDDLNKREIGDIIDVAFNMYEKDRTIQMTESEKRILAEINSSLRRINEGSYGVCVCGDNIDENRLEAIPWTYICLKCVKKKRA